VPFLPGPVFVTNNPAVCRWLESGLTLLLEESRGNGKRDHPQLLFDTLSELHALASRETHGAKLRPKLKVSQTGRFASMTVNEAAERLDVTPQMVRRYCDNGQLTALRHGKRWQIDLDSVEEMRQK
jgi:excisionase family DNA binding protein